MKINYLCFMIVLFILAALFLIFACYMWVKLVFVLCNKLHNYINRNKLKEDDNPYIIEQKARMRNTKNYDEYLKWMRTKGDGMTIEKVIARDEYEAIQKIKKYLND